MHFSANNELALHVANPEAAETFYTSVLGCSVFERTPGWIGLTSGPMRLYLVRDDSASHEPVIPSYDVTNRDAAIARLVEAGCTMVPIGPHAPDGFYVRDPFGVLFDVIERKS